MAVNENLTTNELCLDSVLQLVWSSKNDFLEQYKELNESCMARVYFELVQELVKGISTGSPIDKISGLSEAVEWIAGVTSMETLNFFHRDERNPLQKTNMLILASKFCRIDILSWLFRGNLNNLAGDIITPDAEDEECHNAFYYAVRSSNIELLQTLMDKWPTDHFTTQPDKLDTILSAAYEELKLKNVALSDEMHFFTIDKLVNLRFYVNKQSSISVCDIEDRIDLVLENNATLQADAALPGSKVDEKFLFIASFIARNIHVLKRQLPYTYDKLPWEEMEFCLIIFLTSQSTVQELNYFYRSTITKINILKYLDGFTTILGGLKGNISQRKTPRLIREDVIASIVRTCPLFQGLYDDYKDVRNIYSLNTMNGYIAQALVADCETTRGQLVIKRALQIIGEYLKNTLNSPNLSNSVSNEIFLSASKEMKIVLTDIRNSLSHIHSTDYHGGHKLYRNVLDDLKKIGAGITEAIQLRKNFNLSSTLKTIMETRNSEEIHKIMQLLFHDISCSLKWESLIDPATHDHKLVQQLIDEIDKMVPEKKPREKEIIDSVYKLICKKNQSLQDSHNKYFSGLRVLSSIYHWSESIYHFGLSEDNQSARNRDNFVRDTKKEVKALLQYIPQYYEVENLDEPINILKDFYNSVWERISDQTAANIKLSISKINYMTHYAPMNIHWIDEYGDHVIKDKKNKSPNLTDYQIKGLKKKYMDQLEDILSCNKITNDSDAKDAFNPDRLAIEILLLDIMSILNKSNSLVSNPLHLDDGVVLLTGKHLRNQLAHGNILVDMLFPEHFYALLANAKILTQFNSQNNRQTKIDSHNSIRKLKQMYQDGVDIIDKMQEMQTALIDGNLENLKKSLMEGADLHSRSVNLRSTLHYAAQGPSLDAIKYLINMKVKADSKDIYGQTPLHIAALFGRANNVEYLVKEIKLQISAVDNNGCTPLHLAAQNGHEESVKNLLLLGASKTACDLEGYSSLYYAVANKRIGAVKLLLQQDEDVDVNINDKGFTALQLASEFGHTDLVEYFLSINANPDKKSYLTSWPLWGAAENGHLDVVKILIKRGACVNFTTDIGLTALFTAVCNDHEEIVNILLENEAIVNVCEKICNVTPLHIAAHKGHREIAELLIKYRADMNAADHEGGTPLIWAARDGHQGVVKLLLQNGALVDKKTSILGHTALHLGAMYGGSDIIECLLERGLGIDVRDENRKTPLLLAAHQGNFAAVCTLLAKGANVNSVDDYSNSPLLLSSCRGHIDVSEALINNGANVNHTNSNCMSALHLSAIVTNNEETVKMLVNRGVHVNKQDKNGDTALHFASTGENSASVNALIMGKADINVASNAGNTPLHIATRKNCKIIVEILLTNGAKVNVVNKDGYSALSIAAKSNNKELVDMLIAKGADVNSQGNRPLHSAVFAGHKRIVDTLLKHKDIDLNVEDILHLAAVLGHWRIGKALINSGVHVDVKNSQITPLFAAVYTDKKDFVDMLLANGANVKDMYHMPEKASLLEFAIKCGNPDIVRSLLNAGAVFNIEADENKPEILLELAVVLANLPVVNVLFNHQYIDVNHTGVENCTALHIAARMDTLDVLKYLIAKGADVNVKNTSGSKPIHIATLYGHQKIVDCFLEQGMCVGDLDTDRRQPLHYAAAGDQEALVHYLVEKGADLNAIDDYGDTPLHLSVRAGCLGIVKMLLNYGSYYNVTNKNDSKPSNYSKSKDMSDLFISIGNLFKAVKNNAVMKVENLIGVEPSVNTKCVNNGTLLHLVAWKGFNELCELLLKSKANPNALGKNGNTALHYAAKYSHYRIVQALLAAGAIYNVKNDTGKTPLDLASHHKVKHLLLLIQESFGKVQNCDINVMDDLNKAHETGICKAVCQARNENNQSLIVVAINFHFPEVDKLKDFVIRNLSDTVCRINKIIYQQENFTGAIRFLNITWNDCREKIGDENSITLELQERIALVLILQKKYSQALIMLEEVYQKHCLVFGKNSESSLNTKSHIATVLSKQGKHEEAYDILQEVYEERKKTLNDSDHPRDHLEVLHTKCKIEGLLRSLERFGEASIILKEIFEISEKVFGRFGHIDDFAIRIKEIIVDMLYCIGLQDEAGLREIYKMQMAEFRQNHSKTLQTKCKIADLLVKQNKYDEALKEYQEVLAIQRNVLGPCHLDTLQTEGDIARLYFRTFRDIEAKLVLNSIGLDRRKEILGPHHQDVLILEKLRKDEEFSKAFDIPTQTQSALITAVLKGDKIEVERLITNGFNLDMEDVSKQTPLHFAASEGFVDIVRLLLINGANSAITTLKGNTALHIAASRGDCSVVELLLQIFNEKKIYFNDFINAKTFVGESTALHEAAKRGSKEIVIVLLTYGARYDVIDETFQQTHLQNSHLQGIISLLKAIQRLFESARRGDTEFIAIILAMDSKERLAALNARNNQLLTAPEVARLYYHNNMVVKCDDRAGCGDMRSSLRCILPERFVIPPYLILQSSSGLCIPKPLEHDGKTFATFLLRRSLGITLTHEGFDKLPYDLNCSSLKMDRQQLVARTCQWCGLYFCSKKNVKVHLNSCHKQRMIPAITVQRYTMFVIYAFSCDDRFSA